MKKTEPEHHQHHSLSHDHGGEHHRDRGNEHHLDHNNEHHPDHSNEHHHDHGNEHHHPHHDHESSEDHSHVSKEKLVADLHINDFGWTIWKFSHITPHENGILSPCSLSIPMALLRFGSQGHTFREISSMFRYPSEHSMIAGYHEVISSLQGINELENPRLIMCTVFFVPVTSTFRNEFLPVAESKFYAVVKTLEAPSKEEATLQINSKIRELTEEEVPEVFQPDDLHDWAHLILASAVKFSGKWKFKFERVQTNLQPFYNAGGKKTDVQMMNLTVKCPYTDAKGLGAAIIGLPYVGDRFLMVILLPNKRYGLTEMERQLDGKFWDVAHKLLGSDDEISVHLPRFSTSFTLDIKGVCDRMGMKAMFQESAELGGIFEKPEKEWVSAFLQKSLIEVNEEGTGIGVAASTELGAHDGDAEDPGSGADAITVRVDHPFMYYIVDKKYDHVIMAGIQSKFTAS